MKRIAIAALLALPSCFDAGSPDEAPEAVAWPEGTVLAVDGRPVLAEDVERFVPMIELIEPEFVRRDHLRKILSNITLPTAAAGALVPEDRDAAYQRAEKLLATLRETGEVPAGAPAAVELSGPWVDVGMVSWFEAMNLEPGSFSALHETPGSWTFVELVSASDPPGEFDAWTEITVRRWDVPYLPKDGMHEMIRQALDALAIDVVDPEWEAAVPPLFLYNDGARTDAPDDSNR